MNYLALTDNQTMTSIEVVDVINSLRPEGKAELEHRSFVAKLLKLKDELGMQNILHTPYTHPQNGQTYTQYLLDKETCLIMVASETPKVLQAIIKRWQELESRQATIGGDLYAARLMHAGLLPGVVSWWEELVKRGHLYAGSPKALMVDRRPVFAQLRNSFFEWCSLNFVRGGDGYCWSDDQFRRSLLVLTEMYSVPAICDALKHGDKAYLLRKLPEVKGKIGNIPVARHAIK